MKEPIIHYHNNARSSFLNWDASSVPLHNVTEPRTTIVIWVLNALIVNLVRYSNQIRDKIKRIKDIKEIYRL